MRKKYIFINTLILVLSLLIFLIISINMFSLLNERNTKRSIRNYLSILESSYDGTNMKESSEMLHSSNNNVRVTFIDSNGKVLYDTAKATESNHLDRTEIKNIGTISCRFSDTTNVKMYYLACYDSINNVYMRVSIPEAEVSSTVNKFTYSGLVGIAALSILSFGFIYFTSKKLVKPLKEEINNLSKITNTVISYNGDDIVELSSQIENVRGLINENITAIKSETAKLNYIIENMNNGIVIISGNGKIMLVNNLASTILNKKKEELENSSYIYSFVGLNINDKIECAMNEDLQYSQTLSKDDKTYLINLSSLDAAFVKSGDKLGVALFINDITYEKKLERVKLDFFANASHELKSPLTSIIGYQQMISEGIITDEEEIKDATAKTIKEANRMNQIIIEMLELSRLEMLPNVEKKELSLVNAIESIMDSYDLIIKEKNISIVKEYNDFIININIDELYHLLRNIIDNAFKYNKENGSIYIAVDSNNKTLIIEDSGIGISKENLNRIFERFYRVDKAKSKELGGTGLGLAIVKHICMNNNIRIDVESKIGEGTRFKLIFN